MKKYLCGDAHEAEKNIPDDNIASELADFLKIFADMTRIKILYALLDMELCVHDIATILNMEQSAISHQLRLLRQYKLVKVRKEGKSSYYSLNDSHIHEILIRGYEHISE
ncbi:MAG: helix-turn-helix transcriptional regulator [Clostridiales bacterium]|nr:helix-turn-helix transcriptional regulator [Clostridiales bacterium]